MATEFRKKKYVHAFKTFFDVDGSGQIDQTDFEEALNKIAAFRGWQKGGDDYTVCKEILEQIWEGLKGYDGDGDGKVSQEEWIAMWNDFAANPNSPANWQIAYRRFIFQIVDTSDDGSIDADEFSSLFGAFGLDKDDASVAFAKASGGKAVNFEDFEKLWDEYFSSNDESSPGNFIFGKSSF